LDREHDRQPGHFDTLLEAQRAWLRFRDAQCLSESFMARGGSMQPMLDSQCKTYLTVPHRAVAQPRRGAGMTPRAVGWLLAALMLLAAPLAAQDGAPIVIGESYGLPSAELGAQRTINVWTPPGYAESGRRYPTVYLIDGGISQDFHHITGLAQLGAISWLTQDLIVVGVETVDRRRELAFPIERDAELGSEYPT